MFSGLRTSSIWLPFDEVLRPLNRSEEHTSELQSHSELVCRLLLEKKKKIPSLQRHRQRKDEKEPQGSVHRALLKLCAGIPAPYRFLTYRPHMSEDRLP